MKPRNHRQRCSPHTQGVPPDMGPFFDPGCYVCLEKKAAGKVTGNEPHPATTRVKRMKATMAHGFGMQPDRRSPFARRGY